MSIFRRRSADVHAAALRQPNGQRVDGQETLHYTLNATPGPQYLTDDVGDFRGLSEYRKMQRDAVVASSLRRRVTAMFPGYQIVARDDSPAGLKAAQVVSAIIERMPGSFLQTTRTIIGEGCAMSFAVVEPVWEIITAPGIGTLRGLSALKVRPAESFEGGIESDVYGNITGLKQISSGQSVTPDEVLFWVHDPQPGRITGTSVLLPAYDPWVMRRDARRHWAMYMARLAGGVIIAKAPGSIYEKMQARLMSILTRLQTSTNVTMPTEADITFRETSGVGGQLFKVFDEQMKADIRAAILGSEDVNARVDTGTYGRAKVEQESVTVEIQSDGQAFADWFAEALFTRILTANGYVDAPVPRLLPEPKSAPDVDPVPVLQAIGTAQMQGTLTVALPESTQLAMLNTLLQRAGVDPIKPDQVGRVEVKPQSAMESPADTPIQQAPVKAAAMKRPAGRTLQDLNRIKREWVQAEQVAAARMRETWRSIVPAIVETVNDGLWNKDGAQKITGWIEIRQLVEIAVTKRGQDLNRAFVGLCDERFNAGLRDAWSMMPESARSRVSSKTRQAVDKALSVKAAAIPGRANITPTAAVEALRNDVYITLSKHYSGVQEQVYYALRDGILAGRPSRDIIENLYELVDDSMSEARAATLVNTTLARAYEEARHSVYGELETADLNDPEPGVIIGYESVAVMDDVTTIECAERDGWFFTVGQAAADPIPRHYNCRSTYIPLFSGEEPWTERGWWDGSSLAEPGFQKIAKGA